MPAALIHPLELGHIRSNRRAQLIRRAAHHLGGGGGKFPAQCRRIDHAQRFLVERPHDSLRRARWRKQRLHRYRLITGHARRCDRRHAGQ
jgi:hypothetical protein